MILSASLALVILTVRLVRRRLECDEEERREESEDDEEDGGELPPPPPPRLGTVLAVEVRFGPPPVVSGKGDCPGGGPFGLGGSPLPDGGGAGGLPETE